MCVLSLLSAEDLLHAAQVSQVWRTMAEDVMLWREKCEEAAIAQDQLPPAPPIPAGTDDPTPVKRRCYYKVRFSLSAGVDGG